MCAPCKIIINEMYQESANLADTARRVSLGRQEEPGEPGDGLLISGIYDEPDPAACDEELYELASAEVDAILRVRRSAAAIALNRLAESTKRKEDPRSAESAERWAKLIERLR